MSPYQSRLTFDFCLARKVIVYEHPGNGKTVIGVIDPEIMVQPTGRKDLVKFAKNVRQKLQSAIDVV